MRRLALVLAVVGLCAVVGACEGSRGVTEAAGRVQNIGTSGSGHREGVAGDSTASTQSSGTSGSGAIGGEPEIVLENGGTIGSGH
jgi:hypothetical protein